MSDNQYRQGDSGNDLLRKILNRLAELAGFAGSGGDVSLTVSDVQIGAVELKDADTDTRAKITGAIPGASDNGVVVRNIPSGTQPMSATALPLPAGAATQATLQNVETYLSDSATEDTLAGVKAHTDNIPTQGQKNMAGSLPVVIASNQSAVPVDGSAVVQPVSGPVTDAQLRASAVPVSGPVTDAQLRASAVPVSATQLPGALVGGRLDTNNGAWLGSTAPTVGQKTMASSIPVAIASDQGNVPVTGPLTDAQLRASAVPISAAALPLPAGAATEATLATRLAEATFTGRINTQGQKTMALSTPVVIASDQAAVPVSGPLTDAQLRASAVPVSATQLPAALVGGRLDENVGAWLGSTAPTVGQKTMANAVPVSIASDQSAIPVSGPLTDAQLRASAVPVVDSADLTDNAGFTDGASKVNPSGYIFDEVAGTALTENDVAAARIDSKRAQVFVFEDATTRGQRASVSAAGALKVDGSAVTQPVSGPLTDAQLRASAVPVSGPLTDAQLRASVVPVSATQLPAALVGGRLDENVGAWLGSTAPTVGQKTMANAVPVSIASDQSAVPVSGPLTDTQLRASAVPVSGPVTDAQLRASAVPVSGPLTDAQLRASAVPVSGTVSTKTSLTASSPTASSVGVATASAVAANGNRKGLILVNTSAARISLGIGAAAVLDSGITLYPGDSWQMDEYSFSTAVVNAIASAAASNLGIQEFTT